MPYMNLNLAPHQLRVIDEKAELDSKIRSLDDFLLTNTFLSLDIVEKGRLLRQIRVMKEYSEILGERISAFITAAVKNSEPS